MTAASSHVFIEVRSSIAWPRTASVISSNIGPENVFSATVVRMVERRNPRRRAATRRRCCAAATASIDLVAKAICDWKSIMMSVWSCGVSRRAPGLAWRWEPSVHPLSVPDIGAWEAISYAGTPACRRSRDPLRCRSGRAARPEAPSATRSVQFALCCPRSAMGHHDDGAITPARPMNVRAVTDAVQTHYRFSLSLS